MGRPCRIEASASSPSPRCQWGRGDVKLELWCGRRSQGAGVFPWLSTPGWLCHLDWPGVVSILTHAGLLLCLVLLWPAYHCIRLHHALYCLQPALCGVDLAVNAEAEQSRAEQRQRQRQSEWLHQTRASSHPIPQLCNMEHGNFGNFGNFGNLATWQHGNMASSQRRTPPQSTVPGTGLANLSSFYTRPLKCLALPGCVLLLCVMCYVLCAMCVCYVCSVLASSLERRELLLDCSGTRCQ